MRMNKRLSGGQVLLLAAAVAYTTSAALADDAKPGEGKPGESQPPNEKPQIGDHDEGTRPTVGPAPTSNTQERTFEPKLADPTIRTAPASSREITRTTMDKPLIETYLRTWPEHSSKAARATIAAYGLPNEATPSMFFWIQNGPWLRTIVYKDEIVHDFPRTHYDVVENVIQLAVPISKVNDIVAFEGSAVVQRTEGLVSVRSNNEAMNYLAMNLIYDIANGRRNVLSARKAYARGVVGIAKAEPPADATKLRFQPSDDRAQDPDKPMLKNDYAEPGEKDIEPSVAPPAPPLPSPNDLRGPGGKAGGPKANDLNKTPGPSSTPAPRTPPPAVPGPKNTPGSATK
jgi:hypothetical protein